MGEIICRKCGYMNSHIYCHATERCENCKTPVHYCGSCNMPISRGGEEWAKRILQGRFTIGECKRIMML